jgi:hypothetical protein
MHELLIFFSTLGGLVFFGAMGFIRVRFWPRSS